MRVFGLLLLGFSLSVAAQSVFRWTDEHGQVHYGHSVPAQYRALGYERLAPDGRVLERFEPEMTAEERAEQAARSAEQAEQEAEQTSQAARDRLLLSTYRSEQHLIDTRDARLDAMRQRRVALETSHRHAVQRFEDLIARAAAFSRESQAVPEVLESSVTATQQEVQRLRAAMAELDDRMATTLDQFEQELQHYRSLTHPSDQP